MYSDEKFVLKGIVNMGNVAIELRGITKRFGSIVANKNVNLTVHCGEILSLLGENGSGKTTLMNMISGIYHPDEGQIIINGEEAHINSPHDAFEYKIGMIHQHFKLVDVFSAGENIVLGINDKKKYKKYLTNHPLRGYTTLCIWNPFIIENIKLYL